MQKIDNMLPRRVPVAQRLASQRLVYGLNVVEQVRAGVEKASLVFYGHPVAQAQGALHGNARVAEIGAIEDPGALAILEAAVKPHDLLNLARCNVPPLVTQGCACSPRCPRPSRSRGRREVELPRVLWTVLSLGVKPMPGVFPRRLWVSRTPKLNVCDVDYTTPRYTRKSAWRATRSYQRHHLLPVCVPRTGRPKLRRIERMRLRRDEPPFSSQDNKKRWVSTKSSGKSISTYQSSMNPTYSGTGIICRSLSSSPRPLSSGRNPP